MGLLLFLLGLLMSVLELLPLILLGAMFITSVGSLRRNRRGGGSLTEGGALLRLSGAIVSGALVGVVAAVLAAFLLAPLLFFGGTEKEAMAAHYRLLLLVLGIPGATVGAGAGWVVAAGILRVPDREGRRRALRRQAMFLGGAAGSLLLFLLMVPLMSSPAMVNLRLEGYAAESGERDVYRGIEKRKETTRKDPARALASPDRFTRYTAANQLSLGYPDARALPVLIEASRDPSFGLPDTGPVGREEAEQGRSLALYGLAGHQKPEARQAVRDVLKEKLAAKGPLDGSDQVLSRAIESIGKLQDPRAAPLLEDVVNRPRGAGGLSDAPRRSALESLVQIASATDDSTTLETLDRLSRQDTRHLDAIQMASCGVGTRGQPRALAFFADVQQRYHDAHVPRAPIGR